jgi:hypothetical protein
MADVTNAVTQVSSKVLRKGEALCRFLSWETVHEAHQNHNGLQTLGETEVFWQSSVVVFGI